MATISNTPRPGYVWDATDNVWYPIGVGGHGHPDYITQATAVNPTIIDAKGDILTATAADTPARLAVGTNAQVLTADSTTATGLAWATPSSGSSNVAGKNSVLNSNFSVWQRGTSFTLGATNTYTADRFLAVRQATVTGMEVSRQATGDTTNLPFIQYCARVQRVSGNTSANDLYFGQSFESVNSIPFAGKTVTFSFYARAGANYSPTSSILVARLTTGTGTDQNVITGSYTGSTSPISQNATLTTTWQRFTYTATLATTATELSVWFTMTPTGTAGANDYYEITGVQLEIASSASNYSPNQATYASELAACQRYYWRSAQTADRTFAAGFWWLSTKPQFHLQYPVEMRTAPTLAYSGTAGVQGNQNKAITSTDGTWLGKMSGLVSLIASSATATAGDGSLWVSNGTNDYIELSAEL
jgi:hypothetical protein